MAVTSLGLDNGVEGNTSVSTLVGGGSVSQNNLTIVAINILGTGIAVTPPATSAGHPPWNQIGSYVLPSANIEQIWYWHEIGSAETGAPGFTFGFSSSARASLATVTYSSTCLEDATPCAAGSPPGNPIDDFSFGMSLGNDSVTTGASAINVPAHGEVVAVFGTSNTITAFGLSGNPNGSFSGGLSLVTGAANHNGGIEITEKPEPAAGTDGPFTATMPSGEIGDNVGQAISIFPK